MQGAVLFSTFTRTIQLSKTISWLLVLIIYKHRKDIEKHSAEVLFSRMGSFITEFIPQRYVNHYQNGLQLAQMNIEFSRCDQKICTVATLPGWVWLRRCTSRWHQAPSRRCNIYTTNERYQWHTTVRQSLNVDGRVNTTDDMEINIFGLNERTTMPTPTVTGTDGTNVILPYIPELKDAQAAEVFCHTAAKKLEKAKT